MGRFGNFVNRAMPKEVVKVFNDVEQQTRHAVQDGARKVKDEYQTFKADLEKSRELRKAREENAVATTSSSSSSSITDRLAAQATAAAELKQYQDMSEAYAGAKASIDAAISNSQWGQVTSGVEMVEALQSPKHTHELLDALSGQIGAFLEQDKADEALQLLNIAQALNSRVSA